MCVKCVHVCTHVSHVDIHFIITQMHRAYCNYCRWYEPVIWTCLLRSELAEFESEVRNVCTYNVDINLLCLCSHRVCVCVCVYVLSTCLLKDVYDHM